MHPDLALRSLDDPNLVGNGEVAARLLRGVLRQRPKMFAAFEVFTERQMRRSHCDVASSSSPRRLRRGEDCILSSPCLRRSCRSISKVHDEWFADEERVRKIVGLLEKPVEMPNSREVISFSY
ncbi:hypothetical protein BHM03_00010450 [Ensete ventricosum]|nr:hypothetical protein BHM03_00010450 [Ensete ventricosum]